MAATVESVLNLAMTLSEQDRVVVAEQLAESVSLSGDELSDDLKATLDKRWEEIESGSVVCRDAFEVLDGIRTRLHERLDSASRS